jgi:hypothetical protein
MFFIAPQKYKIGGELSADNMEFRKKVENGG